MKTPYLTYKVADFVLDREFRKWVLNPDRESNQFWQEWLDAHPEKTEVIAEAVAIVKQLPSDNQKLTDQEKEELIRRIEFSLNNPGKTAATEGEDNLIPLNAQSIVEKRSHRRSKNPVIFWVKIAAVLMLIMTVGYVSYLKFGSTAEPLTQTEVVPDSTTHSSPLGQRAEVFLPDGTKVNINAGSSISYSNPFTGARRTVLLSGEAFFEVAEDSIRPFEVVTGDITTQALGTSFNIHQFPDNEEIRISLVTGSAAIGVADFYPQSRPYIINPGEEIIWKSEDSIFSVGLFDMEQVTSWKNGIIYFKHDSQETVLKKLERWYGVEFTIENGRSSNWDLTAKFDNQPLINVLNSLGYTLNFDFTINGPKVVIHFKQ